MNLLKNLLPVSINGQSFFESTAFPNNEAMNLPPIKTSTKPKHGNKIIATRHLTILFQMLQNTLHSKLELLQSPLNQTLLLVKPFLHLNILLLHSNRKRLTQQTRNTRNLLRHTIPLLHPLLHFLPFHQLLHMACKNPSETPFQFNSIRRNHNIRNQLRRKIMTSRNPRFPEPNNSITSIRPLQKIDRRSNTVARVETIIIRVRFTFTDQRVYIVAVECATAEVELEDEIGRTMRWISLRRTVDTVVGVESRSPVTVNRTGGVRGLTVEMGGVVGRKSFLHGESI